MNILEKIIVGLGTSLGRAVILLFDCLEKAMDLVNRFMDKKDLKEKQKKAEKDNKDLKDICDNGTLDDLITKKFGIFIAFLGLFVSGCWSSSNEINIISTKSWEGHYTNVQDFLENTRDIKLQNDESIWLLSNTTLYMLLKDENGK